MIIEGGEDTLIEKENLPIDPKLLEKIEGIDHYRNELVDMEVDLPNFIIFVAKKLQI